MEVGLKLVLLDERDIVGERLPDLEELTFVAEVRSNISPDWLSHYLSKVGYVSERFNTSRMFEEAESDGLIMKYNPTWHEFLVNHLSPYVDQDMEDFFEGGIPGYMSKLHSKLETAQAEKDDENAERFVSALLGMEQSGLPGFRRDYNPDKDPYEQEMIDARSENYGPGRRIIVEAVEMAA